MMFGVRICLEYTYTHSGVQLLNTFINVLRLELDAVNRSDLRRVRVVGGFEAMK